MIILSQTHLTEIQDHAKQTYPEECCGAIFGTIDISSSEKMVAETLEIDNVSTEDRRRRFMITPDEYQRVETYAKKNRFTLLGFYHSHPDHPAYPSETDLMYAWPFFSYIILSIEKKHPRECRSFILDPENQQFQEESIKFN